MKLQSSAGRVRCSTGLGWGCEVQAGGAPTHVHGHEGDDGEDEEEDPHCHVGEEHNLERTKWPRERRYLCSRGDAGLAGPTAAGGGEGEAPHVCILPCLLAHLTPPRPS